MAIMKNITTADQVNHPEAYLKIIGFKLFPREKTVSFEYAVYHNETAKSQSAKPISGGEISVNADRTIPEVLDSDGNVTQAEQQILGFDTYFADSVLKQVNKSPISQAYAYMKANGYSDWSDV